MRRRRGQQNRCLRKQQIKVTQHLHLSEDSSVIDSPPFRDDYQQQREICLTFNQYGGRLRQLPVHRKGFVCCCVWVRARALCASVFEKRGDIIRHRTHSLSLSVSRRQTPTHETPAHTHTHTITNPSIFLSQLSTTSNRVSGVMPLQMKRHLRMKASVASQKVLPPPCHDHGGQCHKHTDPSPVAGSN